MRHLIVTLAAIALATPATAQDQPNATVISGGSPGLDRLLADTDQLVTDLETALASSLRVQASCKAVYDEQERLRTASSSADSGDADVAESRHIAVQFCQAHFPDFMATDPNTIVVTAPAVEHHPWTEDEAQGCWANEEALEYLVNLQTAMEKYAYLSGESEALKLVKRELAETEPGIRAEHLRCYAPGPAPEYAVPSHLLSQQNE